MVLLPAGGARPLPTNTNMVALANNRVKTIVNHATAAPPTQHY
jgi:hypothetical protein